MAALEAVTVLSVKGRLGIPRSIVPDDGVCQDDEFSGHGNDGDLSRFSGVGEPFVEGSERGIAADGGDGGHVEGGADTSAPAADVIAVDGGSAALRVWSQSGHARGLMTVELAEFRQIGDQHGR